MGVHAGHAQRLRPLNGAHMRELAGGNDPRRGRGRLVLLCRLRSMVQAVVVPGRCVRVVFRRQSRRQRRWRADVLEPANERLVHRGDVLDGDMHGGAAVFASVRLILLRRGERACREIQV